MIARTPQWHQGAKDVVHY